MEEIVFLVHSRGATVQVQLSTGDDSFTREAAKAFVKVPPAAGAETIRQQKQDEVIETVSRWRRTSRKTSKKKKGAIRAQRSRPSSWLG